MPFASNPHMLRAALAIVRKAGAEGILLRDFTLALWPGSGPFSRRPAGAFLADLCRYGWLVSDEAVHSRWRRWWLTAEGVAYLDKENARLPDRAVVG